MHGQADASTSRADVPSGAGDNDQGLSLSIYADRLPRAKSLATCRPSVAPGWWRSTLYVWRTPPSWSPDESRIYRAFNFMTCTET